MRNFLQLTFIISIIIITNLPPQATRVGEVKANLLRTGKPWTKTFYGLNTFTKYILVHQTTNTIKIKEVKTVPCYKIQTDEPMYRYHKSTKNFCCMLCLV